MISLRTWGGGPAKSAGRGERGVDVIVDIDTRIERLLDQMENAALSVPEIEKIERKIEFLRSQQA